MARIGTHVGEREEGAQEARRRAERASPSDRRVSLGRIFGVAVHVDWSLWIVFTLVVFSLGSGVFPAWHADWPPALVWGTALAAAILFFASVLLHELAHAWVARVQGIPVRRVTLFLFGGLAHMEGEPRTPKAEFLVAVVGPIVSLVIGACAWLAGSALASPALSSAGALDDPAETLSRAGPLATLLLWLGPVNVMLGTFNLVPGFPLDGGRVLRALLWWRTGDLVRASRWATSAGQTLGWVLIGLGVWNLLAGGLVQGFWFVLIGWFLNSAARVSHEQLVVREALDGVPVRDLMVQRLDSVPPEATAAELIDEHFLRSDQRAFPVVSSDGAFLGLVCFDDVRRVPAGERASARAAGLMTSAEQLVTLSPDAEARTALKLMGGRDVEQIPVLEHGALRGIVRRRDVVKWLALRSESAFDGSRLANA